MLNLFRKVALLEGVSYLALFANMLLIKPNNLALYKQILFPLGMAHGVLFMGYILLAILLKKPQKWNFKTLGIILIASLLPFGTFYIEKKYLRNA
ncbi:DUF3817 domain-containing protein [Flavobacterium terrae]|uniref:Integral membrane protein n=1 Tax=Flavobacterium terrae TaxID=415425 RepID=A0A1M6EJP8_9FLAO|nr:DUF3817 domain-containing protein [Flavobacterium terrae]SHI85742.1 integral membrane protein [Flavobacterium terrae]